MTTRYFPWRVFGKICITLIFLLTAVFVLTLAIATRGFMAVRFTDDLFLLIFVYVGSAFVGGVLTAYRLTLPLRRVILKALRIASKKQMPLILETDDELFQQEPGEYYELEQALDKIRKKLKKRRTQLAHEREEAQALMTFLEEAVFSLDREENIHYYNSKFATQFLQPDQVRSGGQGSDLKLTDVFRDPELLDKIRRSLNNGTAETLQKRMSTRLDRHERFFSMRFSPLREEQNRDIYGGMGIFLDITELKRAEKIRAEFVENASHELRTPLTSIKGYLATAREDVSHESYEHLPVFLEKIAKSVDRLIELTNDLLTISALEANATTNWSMVQPEEVTEEVLERLTPLAAEKKIMLKARFDCDAFKADFKLVDQVLTNLVGNAIKYIPEGSQVDISWSQPRGDKEVCLSVKDNGPGIGEEHLGRLFERFYRIDKGRSRDAGGTGLGLSIVKHIMQTHGGSVEVATQVGQGAEFTCHFPLRG
ncbi:MAG: PAS domain-containing sensor histidine kinase [Bdellovibrio sp.]|nr:MAG: PAS domain-containing sensor histidine kinase [Bdellovibrio sp.]